MLYNNNRGLKVCLYKLNVKLVSILQIERYIYINVSLFEHF